MHGENDWIVSPDQSRKLYDLIKGAGGDATLIIYVGDDHQLTGQFGGFPEAVRWFGRHFGTGTTFEGNSDAIGVALTALSPPP
jgi:dipeptidyl aminopeptidase/acylaminoacyl peptidase